MSTILFYPIADSCINGCLYCFEDPSFKKMRAFKGYDKYKMAKTVKSLTEKDKKMGEPSTVILHGGEVLTLPTEDLEFFFREMKKSSGKCMMQTSMGVPLTPEHIRLFKEYNVSPGVSVDGPPELNILRGPRNPEANKKFQDVVYKNIQILKDNGIKHGTIVVLSKANASPDKIDTLVKWCVQNTDDARFNPLFVPSHVEGSEIAKYALTSKELTNAFMALLKASIENPSFTFKLLEETKSALIGDYKTVCCFSRCDYLTTLCSTVLPDGEVARCDRCFQGGYNYASREPTITRWQMLEQTECKGCKYFAACAGGCPAEGRDGNFRSKTAFCESYYAMFQAVENMLRKLFPGIFLSIDVHNYYEDYWLPKKRFNFLVRYDGKFANTKDTMDNSIKLLGWTPDSEKREKIKPNSRGVIHADSPARGSGKCGCGKQ